MPWGIASLYSTIAAIARTLRQEIYAFTERPELFWQQMYNRLQWEQGIDQKSGLASRGVAGDIHAGNARAGVWFI